MTYVYLALCAATAWIMWYGNSHPTVLDISLTNMYVLAGVFVFCAICAIGYGLRDWGRHLVPPAPEDLN